MTASVRSVLAAAALQELVDTSKLASLAGVQDCVSTDSLCAEPITTKYAGDVAYLTAAFMRQERSFRLHPVLERTPWFI